MALTIRGPFPSLSNTGAIYGDPTTGGVFKFLGGGSSNDPNNWQLIGGVLKDHPDTSAWGLRQQGSIWFNSSLGNFFGWNGNAIVYLG